MKKTQYVVYVHLHQDTGKISHANCSCPAGQGGCCKHVAALLFQLLDFIQLELTEIPDDLSCTQLLQQWHVPPNDKLETALLFDQVKFTKATCKKEKVYQPQYKNPSPAFGKKVTEFDLKKLEDGLKATNSYHYFQGLLKSNHHQPWDYNEYLEGLPSKRAFIDANLYASQLYNNNIRESVLNEITVPDFSEVCKHLPSQDYAPFVQNHLYNTKQQMVDIERNTRGQSDCTLWFEQRRSRLTASNFGSVMSIFPKSHLQKVLSPATNQSKMPESCLWGKTNEQIAIAKYLEQLKSDEKSVTACTQCGLFINTETPWLGASPDCLLHGPNEEMPLGLGEVKCPSSKKDMTISEACQDSSFFLAAPSDKQSKPTLKHNHNYYIQVQGLMAACKVKWADFIVYTKQETFTERIYFNAELWYKTMLPELTSFYFTYIYPELTKQ